MKVTPKSMARWSARRDSSSSAPIHSLLPIPQAPKPISDTCRPVRPRIRYSTALASFPIDCHPAPSGADWSSGSFAQAGPAPAPGTRAGRPTGRRLRSGRPGDPPRPGQGRRARQRKVLPDRSALRRRGPVSRNRLTWDLESLFPGGSRSQAFADFVHQIAQRVEPLAQWVADLAASAGQISGGPAGLDDEARERWVQGITDLQEVGAHLQEAQAFVSCLIAQDVHDEPARVWESRLTQLSARYHQLL